MQNHNDTNHWTSERTRMNRTHRYASLALVGLLAGHSALAGESAPGVTIPVEETSTVVQDSTPNGMPPELAQFLGQEPHPAMYGVLSANEMGGLNDMEAIRASIPIDKSFPDETFFGNLKIKFPAGFKAGSPLEQMRVALHQATEDDKIDELKLKRGDARSALHALHRKTKEGPSSFTVDIPDETGAATCWSFAGRENPECAAEIDGVIRKAVTESGFGSWINDVEEERTKALQALASIQRTARGEVVNLVAYLQIVLRTDQGRVPPGDLKNSAEILDDPKEHLGFEPEIDFDDLDVRGTSITAENEGGYWIQPNTDNVAWAYYKRLGVAALIGSLDRPEGFIAPYDPNALRSDSGGGLGGDRRDGGLLEGTTTDCPQQTYGLGDCNGSGARTTSGVRTTSGSVITGGGSERYRHRGRPPVYGDGYIPGSAARSLNPRRRTEGQAMMAEIAGRNVELLKIARNAGDNEGLKVGAAMSALALTLGGAIAANQQEPAHVRSTVDFLDSPVYTPPTRSGTGTTTTRENTTETLARRENEIREGTYLGKLATNLGEGVIAPLEEQGITGTRATRENLIGTDDASLAALLDHYENLTEIAQRQVEQFDYLIGENTTSEVKGARGELAAATANLQQVVQAFRTKLRQGGGRDSINNQQYNAALADALTQFRAAADLAQTEFSSRHRATSHES